ncbi:MAG: 3'(2'),5'-bisphosphate nucleotidase CysQ [Ignavibacteriales bacterium]|nr:3'(2'),5'-bisphosphate nucleotidase CysQ [Ignavibacteriales bacterium]
MNIEIAEVIKIAQKAGEDILKIYNSENFNIEIKEDHSPLTRADKASHQIIEEGLKKIYPEIPILSEEGKEIEYEIRKNWKVFWLVDPLDGTKEFIKRNGEFTVNIALVKNNIPVLGVIYVPVTKEIYYGSIDVPANKIDVFGCNNLIKVSTNKPTDQLNVVQSRSHSGDEEKDFYSKYQIKERLSKGSSIKICLVAEGKADIYFRGGPTWEWDTAAGHAILTSAGGKFTNKDESKLMYNKEVLKHHGFIASSSKII